MLTGLLLACTQSVGVAAEGKPEYRILMLYGSERISLWIQGYNERLLGSLPTDVEVNITIEMLPLPTRGDMTLEQLADSLNYQHRDLNPDLVVSVLTEAIEFDRGYGHIYAPDAPRLSILPGPEILQDIKEETDHYVLESGINEAARSTLSLIPQLLPETEQIYAIGGATPGDRSYFSRIRTVIEEMDLGYNPIFLEGLTTDELLEALSDAPEHSVVILSTYDEDRYGNQMRTGIIPELIGESTEIPVFALFNSVLGMGAVIGGSITDAALYGERSAEMILAIRDGGTNLDSVAPPVANVFDAERLQRYGINRNLLPIDSILINDNQPLWQQYITEIVIACSIIIVQMILIIALIQAMRRQKHAELLLRQTQKMEALGKVSGGVAHDFNNVLMAIMGNAEMAKIYMDKEPKTALGLLDKVLTASDRARNLVTQILMFSRKADEEEMKSVNLRETLIETIDMLRDSANQSMNVELHCPKSVWNVKANTTQIQQVIMNLCNNAWDAMDKDGNVEIQVRNEQILESRQLFQQELPAGDYLSVSIKDSGCGIDKEEMSRVFEPFYTTKEHGKGTGLGLALVYGIVKAHGGYIDIKSYVNEGTTVSCFFKASTDKASEEKDSGELKSRSGHKESILLVDDDLMVLDAICKILTELGYSVDAFNRPVDALHSFNQKAAEYDLVFSDLSMPEMDGMRLIQNIRETRPEIPSILCTGYLDSLNQLEAEKLQNFSTLKKPFNVDEISRKVHAALAA